MKRLQLKSYSRMALLAALLLLVVGCGEDSGADDPADVDEPSEDVGDDGEDESDAESDADSDTGDASGEAVELTAWFTQEEGTPSFDEFEAENPNISVNVDIIPADDVFVTLQRMQDAGDPLPDLIRFDGFLKAGLTDAGLLRPIDDMVTRFEEEDPDLFAMIPPEAWEATQYNGETMGLAYDVSLDQIYYRSDLFEEAGLPVPFSPVNWDEVLDAARAMKQEFPDIVPWGMWGARGDGANYLVGQMSAAGVPFEGAVPDLTSDEGLYLIEWYQTLMREGLVATDVLAWGEDEGVGAYLGGRAAMTIESIGLANDLAEVEDLQYPDNWRLALFPRATTGTEPQGQWVGNPWTFGITAASEHPYEASLLLRYLATPEIALEVSLDNIVRHEAVYEGNFLAENYPALEEEHIEAHRVSDGFPTGGEFFEVQNVLEQFMQDVLQNPEEPAEDIAARWQGELPEPSGTP